MKPWRIPHSIRRVILPALSLVLVLAAAALVPGQAEPPPGGPRPDRPPPGAKPGKREVIDTLERWRESDRQILESARKYNDINARKKKLDQRLGEARGNFDPTSFTLPDVGRRKDAAKTMEQLEGILTDMRKQREKIGRLAWNISGSRKELGSLLESRRKEIESKPEKDRLPDEAAELARVLAWERSIEAGMEDGPQEFYLHLLGRELAPDLLESVREPRRGRGGKERPARPPLPGSDGPPPDMNAFDPRRDNTPEAMEERLHRLERSQRTQQAVIRRQREEIQSLRERLSKYEAVEDSDSTIHAE